MRQTTKDLNASKCQPQSKTEDEIEVLHLNLCLTQGKKNEKTQLHVLVKISSLDVRKEP